MLHLVQSNKMEVLTQQLAEIVAQQPVNSIFTPTTMLVQSPGMAQWLKLQLAEQLGIAANLNFPLPSSYIWDLYRAHIEALPEESAFTKANMTWKLMAVLPPMLVREEFSSLRDYFGNTEQQIDQLKLYQLCLKIADIFDQYLVYRPDWIRDWEDGNNQLPDTDVTQHAWQPKLWRSLLDYSSELNESEWHRANLHQALLSAIENTQVTHEPLYVFGISALPQQQLEVLAALAKQVEVYIFWCNPSVHYWADVIDQKTLAKQALSATGQQDYWFSGNPLLSSWGKMGRDYQDMLLALDPVQTDLFVEHAPKTLLEQIQHEVLELTQRGSMELLAAQELLSNGQDYPKIAISQDDKSLHLHACHSPVRELEVLHDQLLHMFKQNSSLQPSDVIVMLPDVAAYAPLIDGVFGSVEDDLHIPYAIADRNIGEESTIVGSFLQLMALHKSRLSLAEVLSIFEVPAIQQAFSVDAEAFDNIANWLSEAGVRWAADGDDKLHYEVPAEQQNTWQFGLSRLLAGYAMQSDLWHGQDTVAPYAHIEGQQAEALGKFYLFYQKLLEVQRACRDRADLAHRCDFALELLDSLYLVAEQEQAHLNSLRETISALKLHHKQYSQGISQDVFLAELQQDIQQKGVGQKFLAGYLNFCTLMPMRSIPFKVVCLLGMNDADYPRQVSPVGFDLMRTAKARKGDRSRRLDDRYLFLEAILSARECLYLSHVGLSQRDNSPLSPSILVSELLEYCQQSFCLSGQYELEPALTQQNLLDHLRTEHKLQPFDRYYYSQLDSVKSFNTAWLDALNSDNQTQPVGEFCPQGYQTQETTETETSLQLSDLIQFYMNPAKYFVRQRWQTSLSIYAEQTEDTEPFTLDGLSAYQVKERLLKAAIQQKLTDWPLQLASEGQLPNGYQGQWSLDKISQGVEQQTQRLQPLLGSAEKYKIEVDIEFVQHCIRLQGWLDNFYGDTLLFWRPGKLRGKDALTCWITWLAACASDNTQVQQACFVASDKSLQFSALPQVEARQQLSHLIRNWQQGQQRPLCFFPESAWTWANSQDQYKTLSSFAGNHFVAGEGQEPHIYRLFPDLSAVFDNFQQTVDQLMLPMLEVMSLE